MTRVKICGITRLEDARAAIEAGADAIGFNFYRESRRYLRPEQASEIVAACDGVRTMGVFVNASAEEIRSVAGAAGLRHVQLHGDESPELIALLVGLTATKTIPVEDGPSTLAKAQRYRVPILLDASSPTFGGTGMAVDWQIAASVRSYIAELWLAGGLHAGNVARAIATVRPDWVDVCSGVELRPGHKDHDQMGAFITAVHQADREL